MSSDKGAAYINDAGRTMVPLRSFVETIGHEVLWDDSSKTITIVGQPNVYFKLSSHNYRVGEIVYSMDTTPTIIGDRTYIPLRFAAEAMGYSVDWNDVDKIAYCE